MGRTWAAKDGIVDGFDEGHRELVWKNHEVSNLFQHNFSDDVTQPGSIKGVCNAAQIEVDVGWCEKINLRRNKGN